MMIALICIILGALFTCSGTVRMKEEMTNYRDAKKKKNQDEDEEA